MRDIIMLALWDAFWAAIPAVGFAMLFSVPPRFCQWFLVSTLIFHIVSKIFEEVSNHIKVVLVSAAVVS